MAARRLPRSRGRNVCPGAPNEVDSSSRRPRVLLARRSRNQRRRPSVILRRRGLAVKARMQGLQRSGVRLRKFDQAASLPDRGVRGLLDRGRGGAGRAARRPQSGEGGRGWPGRRGVLDGGDNAQSAATSEDIEGEHAAHQCCPGPIVPGDGSAGAALDGVAVTGRAAVLGGAPGNSGR
jgi:hypothetical protein